MPVRREDIEALPGFVRWSSFGERGADALPSGARIYFGNGDIGCVFAREALPHEANLIFDYLRRIGPKDESYLWDGSQKGWKLVFDANDIRVAVRFGGPLDELSASRLDVLRDVLGESTFNHLNAFSDRHFAVVRGKARRGHGSVRRLERRRLRGRDFEGSYGIHRELNGESVVLLIEDEAEHARRVERMLEAGVPVATR